MTKKQGGGKNGRIKARTDTIIVTAGRKPQDNFGIINPPVYHASTVLFPSVKDLARAVKNPFDGVYYGRIGTPTTQAFEEAVCALEGGYRTIATSSGQAAIVCALTAFLKSGDHLLMVDSAYQPTRKFCDSILKKMGVETTYYDPLIGAKIEKLFKPNTRVVFMESPGSMTFEVQDVPAIVKAARKKGLITMIDNTWATPLYFAPLSFGVDVSILSATKYINGHADAMLGTITLSSKIHFVTVKTTTTVMGNAAGPDDCYLGQRGMRTLSVRLQRHQETGLKLARWLSKRREVARVLHPALPSCPGHKTWKRDYCGASGLFSVILKPVTQKSLHAMLDNMKLFGMGFSWGGYESLILPSDPAESRSAVPWESRGPLVRIHAGLEDADDLIADLDEGLKRLKGI